MRVRRLLLAVALAALATGVVPFEVLAAEPAASASATPRLPAVPDLAGVVISPGDLPAGFVPSSADARSFTSLAHALAGGLESSPDAEDRNTVVLERRVDGGAEFVTQVLIGPLSAEDQAAFDGTVMQADRLMRESVESTLGDAQVTTITGMRTGVSRFAVAITMADLGIEYRAVAARRGPVLEVIGHAWTTGSTPVTSLADVAGIIDARLAAAVGSEAPVYRPTGPLVPVITTHIPTPLDVSTDPAVVGTNLVLAAVALLLLTVSSKVATRLLAEHEAWIAAHVPGVGAMGRLEHRLGSGLAGHIRHRRLLDAAALAGAVIFYGVVFSLLEPSWEPLTLTGLWLLISFTLANAVVGLGDDLAGWAVARRWGLPASLGVRPTGSLLAIGSVGVSRVAAVVPGLMFGTPEVLQLDDAQVPEPKARRLAFIGVAVLVAVGGVAWAITMATGAVAREGELTNGLAGMEALLLLVFAAALQNLFLIVLGFGAAGAMLRARSRTAWALAAAAVTFLFFHTLLNPLGDPAAALDNRNVQVTMGLVLAFSLGTGCAWLVARLAAPPAPRVLGPPVTSPAAATPGMPVLPAAAAAASAVQPQAMSAQPQLMPVEQQVMTVQPGWPGAPGTWISIPTADGSARGRAWFASAGGMVVARVALLDRRAVREYRALALLSGAGLLVPPVASALAGRGAVSDLEAAGLLALLGLWLATLVAGRLWLERHRIVHTTVFPMREVVACTVGRDLGIGCALAILLTPLIGLLYLAVTGGRVVKIAAPLLADASGPVTVRCKGSEMEALALRQLLLGSPG